VGTGFLLCALAQESKWSGTVSQKLDIEHKNDSLKRVEKAIV
jgi:hypothetical protein